MTQEASYEENVAPTVTNDDSVVLQANQDQRRNIQAGAGKLALSLVSQTAISDHNNRQTNKIYATERLVRLDFCSQAIEEFPFWEIDQKQPFSMDLSSNDICDWPA